MNVTRAQSHHLQSRRFCHVFLLRVCNQRVHEQSRISAATGAATAAAAAAAAIVIRVDVVAVDGGRSGRERVRVRVRVRTLRIRRLCRCNGGGADSIVPELPAPRNNGQTKMQSVDDGVTS
jgi:hypothetical protein